ncbi:MAG TPA: metalloregulator ArsR/SmtB family transcription factor [Hyphomonas sp.]|nr:transcriptional regulator [Hyphomonas sp.]HRJ01591.1 metalloregulator ArsR/SmtB family transcription factor [Hyphomonas sp.]HRK66546.1 metalloregulator ArsR/SmtB family transcription factor [Hyphomonas sp.]
MAPPFAREPDIDPVGMVFHALSDRTRRTILEQISERPASLSEVARPLGLSLAAIVQHVQVLEGSGLVRTEKVGRVRTCQLAPEGLALAAGWIEDRRRLWNRRFDRLADLLDEEDDS